MVESNFVDSRILLLYWVPFVLTISAFPFGVLCMALAPLGAVICVWTAKKKQLPVLKFAIAGALLSMFLLLPWLYLISRMSGKQFPRSLAVLAYIAVYSIWLYGPLTTYFWLQFTLIEFDELYTASRTSTWMVWTGAASWIVSLTRLTMAHRRRSDADDAYVDILPKQEYIIPFALLFGYTVFFYPTVYSLWWLVVPVSLSASAWLIYPLFKWLHVIVRGRYDSKLHRSLKLHLAEKGVNELTVSWHGDPGLTYEARADGGLYRRTESHFQHTFYGLAPRTNYRISVRAVSRYGARGTPTTVYLGTADAEDRCETVALDLKHEVKLS